MNIITETVPQVRTDYINNIQMPGDIKDGSFWVSGLSDLNHILHEIETLEYNIDNLPVLISYHEYLNNNAPSPRLISELEISVIKEKTIKTDMYYTDLFIKNCFDGISLHPYFYVIDYINLDGDSNYTNLKFNYHVFNTTNLTYTSWYIDKKEVDEFIFYNNSYHNDKVLSYMNNKQIITENKNSLMEYIIKEYKFKFSTDNIESIMFEVAL